MEDIDKRLKETSEACIKCYETWNKDQKDVPARESMQEAIHELRKVAARLEIEMAISERNEMTSKPIPIPSHRSSRRKDNNKNAGAENGQPNGDNGNDGIKKQPKVERKAAGPRRRRTSPSE